MPRLSLYKPERGKDDNYISRVMHEMFTVGGVDLYVHKYLGPLDQPNTSATSPGNTNPLSTGITGIQDLLFLENRDRKYDTSVYTMRGVYRINDNDFDLQQFGLFLTGDTMFATFHYRDMIDIIGRKLMIGDVMEMPNLIDYYPLDEGISAALKRFYVVQDASRAAEGFAATWWPHLWRVKLQPLVDSQEYKDILNNVLATDSGDSNNTLGQVLSTYNKYLAINDAVVTRAEEDVPESGYDTSAFYTLPVDDGGNANILVTPTAKVEGYLTGDGLPPNGATVNAGVGFPASPTEGQYFLRLDFAPNRLFRYNGTRWVAIEDAVRTSLTPGAGNKTQLSGFINDTNKFMSNSIAWDAIRITSNVYVPEANSSTISFTFSSGLVVTNVPYLSTYGAKTRLNNVAITNTVSNAGGTIGITVANTYVNGDLLEYTIYSHVINERQSLSQALRPSADNL